MYKLVENCELRAVFFYFFFNLHRLFCRTTQTGILFSYKHQVDDIQEDDQLSLPYQTPFVKGDGDSTSTDGFAFGSTHFDRHANSNPSAASSSSPTTSVSTAAPYLTVNSDYYQVST